MTFTILIVLFIIAIIFVHSIQGFFSATLSAILTVVAAVFAFSYHESVAESLFAGKLSDTANSIALLALFALIYLVLRIIFDMAIPGNVRVPVAIDKGGAIVMGLIAGIFATGVMAVAAQELPFGPDIAGFTRFDVEPTRSVKVDLQGRGIMSATWDELSGHNPGSFQDPGQTGHGVPIIPVDDILVGLVNRLSSPNGALEDGKPLSSIHPDFLDEMFAQRLGIETTADHDSINDAAKHLQDVKVQGLYMLDPKIQQLDAEYDIRYGGALKPIALRADQMFLVVRMMVGQHAQDKDGIFRFSPASCRLVVDRPGGASDLGDEPGYADLYPVGTLQGVQTLYLNKIDDFLFIDLKGQDKGADLVYVVDKKLWDKAAPSGAFLEVKRLARVDLSGDKVNPRIEADPQIDVMRKYYIQHPEQNPELPQTRNPGVRAGAAPSRQQPAQQRTPRQSTPQRGTPQSQVPQRQPRGTPQGEALQSQAAQTSAASASGPLFYVNSATSTDKLGFVMALARRPKAGELLQIGTGTLSLESGKIKSAAFDLPIHDIPRGGPLREFLVPPGQVMVRVSGNPPTPTSWGFATEPEKYEVVDSQGKHYQPNGFFAKYSGAGGLHFTCRYISSTTISGAPAPQNAGSIAELFLYYNVPAGVAINEFDVNGQRTATLHLVPGQ